MVEIPASPSDNPASPPAGRGATSWSRERVEKTAATICSPAEVEAALEAGKARDTLALRDLLHKAGLKGGLTAAEAAVLLQTEDRDLREEIVATARRVQSDSYRGRVALSTPICPSNRCVNDCLYCPLRRTNLRLRRRVARSLEAQREVLALLDEGYRHLTLVLGDDRSGVHYVRDMISAIYGVRSGFRQIERVDLNADPMPEAELAELRRTARVGTYYVFQETYHPGTYARLHRDGPKADYAWRLTCHDRAYEAGFEQVGLGVLLGAHDYRFDVVALLMHAEHLARTYGRPPQAVAYPRMIPVPGVPEDIFGVVSDEELCFIVAVTRLALPCVDLLMCTPASTEVRRDLYGLGISQVSVGSLSYPGVYTSDGDPSAAGALAIGRPRALEVLVYRLCDAGFLPSLCASCDGARPAGAGATDPDLCLQDRSSANALVALKEYLLDHASPETQAMAGKVIQAQLSLLPEDTRRLAVELMEEVEAGLRRQRL